MTSIGSSTRSKTDSVSNGVFARLIENWLTETPERGFESPFCQLLLGERHTIVHIDSHSPQEDGKDVLTFDAAGRLCGFQLKAGDISVSRWRDEVQGELRELVEMPCHHPNVKDRMCKRAYLVTTGTLSEPALHKLERFNTELPSRFAKVELVDKNALLHRMLECQDAILPSAPADFKAFLELMLVDGQAPLNRESVAAFLASLTGQGSKRAIRRSLAASALTASYAMTSHVREENHLAEAEAWSMFATFVVRSAVEHNLDDGSWESTATIGCHAAVNALNRLADEALANPQLRTRSPLGDGGDVWRARMLQVCGAMAAARLARRVMGQEPGDDSPYMEFILKNLRRIRIWGESAIADILCIYWFLSTSARHQQEAENFLAFGYVRGVAAVNGGKTGKGMPGPHHSAERCLDWALGLRPETFQFQSFRGLAYTLHPCVFLLAKALRKQALNLLWYDIANVGYCHIDIDNLTDFLTFKSSKGTFRSEHLSRPCSWRWLRAEQVRRAENGAKFFAVPAMTRVSVFPLLFAMTHPHRITVEFALWLDDWVRSRT